MSGGTFLQALLVGTMAMLALFLVLDQLGISHTSSRRRATAIFSAAAGILVTLYLLANLALLDQVVSSVVVSVLGIMLAALFALRGVLRLWR
jgi:hypothetical protein